MAKAGDEYRELVGDVARALEPGATVKTEQWIEGPDGDRDMDVEVRGTLDGRPHFVLIECKDHARPIGIGYVDAFESKCRDLKPDRRIMFSNSGFTEDALKKAARVGVEMASALKAMDKTIRVGVDREVVAKRLSIRLKRMSLHPFPGQPHEVEEGWHYADLTFDNLPIVNWVDVLAADLVRQHEDVKKLKYLCTFRPEPHWAYKWVPISVAGLVIEFGCAKDWVSQTVRADVSLGYYDHHRRSVVVPSQQAYSLGWIDREAWKETDQQWNTEPIEPGTFRLNLAIIRSLLEPGAREVPNVNALIIERRADVEE